MAAIVYSKRYDIRCFGLEKLHPFDSCKYGRAWRALRRIIGPRLKSHWIAVDRPVTDHELLRAHTAEYLASIRHPKELAMALEIPALRRVPGWILRWLVVRPMRWAIRGSILAAEAALKHGVAVNLSGGYHHAKPDRGEGFCLFSDIALAIHAVREGGLAAGSRRIAYIDLDAHQGNGVCHQFVNDPEVFIFDMYNPYIYPCADQAARRRIDCNLALPDRCAGAEYLRTLERHLPQFLDSLCRSRPIGLGVYNAGTDVFVEDPLGGLALTRDDILQRDLFVIDQFRGRGIPVVMLPSGGYTHMSHQLIIATVARLLQSTELGETP